MEGISQRGRLARRASQARRTSAGSTTTTTSRSRATRRSPSARTWRRASSATAGTSRASATRTTSRCSTAPSRRSRTTTDRPTLIIVDSHIGYGAPHKQDTQRRARRAARRGRDPADQAATTAGRRTRSSSSPTACASTSSRASARAAQAARGLDGRKLRGVQEGVSRAAPTSSDADAAARAARRLGPGAPDLPRRREGRRQPRCLGQVLNAVAPERPVADRRRGRPRAFDEDAAHLRGRRRLRGRTTTAGATSTSASASTRWAPSQRPVAVQGPPVRLGLPHLQRLRPAADPAGRAHGDPVIHIFTHDSIGVGEDGPTHQPVEHLASLRAIPGLITLPPRRRERGASRRGESS